MIKRLIAVVFVVLCGFGVAQAETYPKHSNLYVNDFAELLSIDDESDLRRWLTALHKQTGIEFTVLTIKSMKDYGHLGEIEPYATRLFNAWGIGNAKRNDGVLMLVARDDRQMRIEVGSGYPASLDAKLVDVIDTAILPRFKKDDYPNGIRDGVAQTVLALTGKSPLGFRSKSPSWLAENFAQMLLILVIAIAAVFVRRGSSGDDSSGGGSFGGGSSSGGGASGRW